MNTTIKQRRGIILLVERSIASRNINVDTLKGIITDVASSQSISLDREDMMHLLDSVCMGRMGGSVIW